MKAILLLTCTLLFSSLAAQNLPFFEDRSAEDPEFAVFKEQLGKAVHEKDFEQLYPLLADSISNFGYVSGYRFMLGKSEFIRTQSYHPDTTRFFNWIAPLIKYGFKPISPGHPDNTPNNGPSLTNLFAKYPNAEVFSNWPFTDLDLEREFMVLVEGTEVRVRREPSFTSKVLKHVDHEVTEAVQGIPAIEENMYEHNSRWINLKFKDGTSGYVHEDLLIPWGEYFTKIYVIKINGAWKLAGISLPIGC